MIEFVLMFLEKGHIRVGGRLFLWLMHRFVAEISVWKGLMMKRKELSCKWDALDHNGRFLWYWLP